MTSLFTVRYECNSAQTSADNAAESLCEVREDRSREIHTSIMGMNEMTFTRATKRLVTF